MARSQTSNALDLKARIKRDEGAIARLRMRRFALARAGAAAVDATIDDLHDNIASYHRSLLTEGAGWS